MVFKKLLKILLVIIAVCFVFLRFFRLGMVPEGFFVDEASLGYNAYLILEKGVDEWGKSFPLFFRALGETKLPLYIYLTVPFIAVFGKNVIAVRLLSALSGIASAVLTKIFVNKFLKQKTAFKDKKVKYISWFSGFLMLLVPWSFVFSRAALQPNLSLVFLLLGMIFWVNFEEKKKLSSTLLANLCFLAAIFTYNGMKLFIPLLMFYLAVRDGKEKKLKKPKIIFYLVFGLVVFISVFFTLTTKGGAARLKGISVFHSATGAVPKINNSFRRHELAKPVFNWLNPIILHNKLVFYIKRITKNFIKHFSLNFLFLEGDSYIGRFDIPETGLLYLSFIPFLFWGIKETVERKMDVILFWLFSAPLISAFTFESPSVTRATPMLPVLVFLTAIGTVDLLFKLKEDLRWKIAVFFLLILTLKSFVFLDNYFVHQITETPYHWDYGYQQAVNYLDKVYDDYEKIYVSKPGQPYIQFLFFTNRDGLSYQELERKGFDKYGFTNVESLGKYKFMEICDVDLSVPKERRENALYVCENEPEVSFKHLDVLKRIDYRDTKQAFIFFKIKESYDPKAEQNN